MAGPPPARPPRRSMANTYSSDGYCAPQTNDEFVRLLLAQSCQSLECPFLGAKRACRLSIWTSQFDPFQTSRFMGGNYVMIHPATWILRSGQRWRLIR
jgi:hypothetical protein